MLLAPIETSKVRPSLHRATHCRFWLLGATVARKSAASRSTWTLVLLQRWHRVGRSRSSSRICEARPSDKEGWWGIVWCAQEAIFNARKVLKCKLKIQIQSVQKKNVKSQGMALGALHHRIFLHSESVGSICENLTITNLSTIELCTKGCSRQKGMEFYFFASTETDLPESKQRRSWRYETLWYYVENSIKPPAALVVLEWTSSGTRIANSNTELQRSCNSNTVPKNTLLVLQLTPSNDKKKLTTFKK